MKRGNRYNHLRSQYRSICLFDPLGDDSKYSCHDLSVFVVKVINRSKIASHYVKVRRGISYSFFATAAGRRESAFVFWNLLSKSASAIE